MTIAPIPFLFDVVERASRNAAGKTEGIQLALMGPQARLDVAQALPKGELRKRHHQEPIAMRERQCWVAA